MPPPLNTYVRQNGAWVNVGTHYTPPPPPPPPIDPEDPPPEPPPLNDGQFTHGSQILRDNIGWGGTLTTYTGPTTLTGTQVLSNVRFNGVNLTIAAGANITLRNFQLIGPAGSGTYVIRQTAGGGSRLAMENGEIVARAGGLSCRCMAMWGDVNLSARRVKFRGGIDNIYVNPNNSPGVYGTGDPVVPAARALVEECWFGDLQRLPGSHSDNFQIDGGGYTLFRRSKLMSFNIPEGSDPLTTFSDTTSERAGTAIIGSQNSSNPAQISNICIRDCWADGGNNCVDIDPGDGLPVIRSAATGNKFGIRMQYAPLGLPADLSEPNRDNRWGTTGQTQSQGFVTAGQLVPGSTA